MVIADMVFGGEYVDEDNMRAVLSLLADEKIIEFINVYFQLNGVFKTQELNGFLCVGEEKF